MLNNQPPITYASLFCQHQAQPQPADPEKKGWVCKICGYVYEGEVLPADFVRPCASTERWILSR